MNRAYVKNCHSIGRGFTIVELLIVIVVIGILAAISIVAYNGVSNNANDTAVKNDLSNFAKQVEMYYIENGSYPAGSRLMTAAGTGSGGYFSVTGLKLNPSKNSYLEPTGGGDVNLAYCTGYDATANQPRFNIMARSKSRQTFLYTSTNGITSPGVVGVTSSAACVGIGYPYTFAYGYSSSSGWQAWVSN